MAERVLVDTSILIGLLNEKKWEGEFLALNQRAQILLSVVTANELLRGAHDPLSRKIVDGLLDIVDDRFVTPSESHWMECARISGKILRESRRSKKNVLSLQSDLLIALGTRDAGATLVTNDKKDFSLLKPYVKVAIEFW